MPLKKAAPSVSPGVPKAVAAALAEDPKKELQALISSAIQVALQPLIIKIDNLEKSFKLFQQQMGNLEKSTRDCKQELEQTQLQVVRNESKIQTHAKKFEMYDKQVILLQTEQAKKVLRLQNLPEIKGELRDQTSTLLAPLVKIPKEAMASQIESIYRVFSAYTKKMNLPREVYIKFTNKQIRDEVLRNANDSPVIIGDKKLNFLKDIPFLARQKRKKYRPLTKLLMENKIKYIWLTIEGVLFDYGNKSYKISSEAKLRDFLKKHGSDLGYKETETADVDETEGERNAQEGEELQGASGLAEITRQLKRYSFRERDK